MGRACLAGIVIALTGCTTTPPDRLREPAFEPPARFDFSGVEPQRQQWWRSLDDPGLDRLVSEALDRSFTLRAAYARVEQARAVMKREGAPLLPSVDARFEQSATRRPDKNGPTVSNSGNSVSFNGDRSNWSDSRSLRFTASYELDIWGRLRNRRKAAAFDTRERRAALQSAAITLAGDVATSWYRWQELQARIEVLRGQIKTNNNVLDLTRYAFKHGQAQAADILRQRRTVASVRGKLEKTRANEEATRHALAVLVGQPPGDFEPPDGQLVDLPSLPATGVPAALLMRRPDVRQKFYALAAADRRVAAAVTDRYPHLSLSATLSSNTDSGDVLSNWITQLAADLTQSVIDGGKQDAEVERTRAVVDEKMADYQQAMLEGLQDVDDALYNERHQKDYIDSLGHQLELSKKTVDNLRLRYLRGSTDYLDVLNGLVTRQNLQLDRLAAQRQLLDYRIDLYRALAGRVVPARAGGETAAPAGKAANTGDES